MNPIHEISAQNLALLSLQVDEAQRARRLQGTNLKIITYQEHPNQDFHLARRSLSSNHAGLVGSGRHVQQLAQQMNQTRSQHRVAKPCRMTIGNWCGQYERQIPIQYKPAPRGSKQCPNYCNKVGNCNYDTGLCDCPAGEPLGRIFEGHKSDSDVRNYVSMSGMMIGVMSYP